MKILIAEDDRLSRTFMAEFMADYGECHLAADGMQAMNAYIEALKAGEPYDLLCLDIMMPEVDGLQVLKVIRELEEQNGVATDERLKIIMMTAVADMDNINEAFELGCDAYASKPIDTDKIKELLAGLGIMPLGGKSGQKAETPEGGTI